MKQDMHELLQTLVTVEKSSKAEEIIKLRQRLVLIETT